MSARLEGILSSWNDDRGFGFITPSDRGQQVFVHIKEFAPGFLRPEAGDLLTYELGASSDGRTRALRVRGPGSGSRRVRGPGSGSRRIAPSGVAGYLAIILFVAVFVGAATAWPIPLWLPWLYLGAGIVCFVAYALDKFAAITGRWRISEFTLLLLGLIGGWPGAIIAQQALRHKTLKASFRASFWVTVLVNVIAFVVVCSPAGATLLGRIG